MTDSLQTGQPIPTASGGKLYPLSYEQQTTYMVELHSPDAMFSPHFIIHLVLRLEGPLRYELLQAAFEDVIARHSALRTRLALAPDEDIVQEEFPEARRPLLLSQERLGDGGLEHLLERLSATPIPFDDPPLIRGSLHKVGEDEHLLFLGIHHLAADATGLFIALEDLSRAYEARLQGNRLVPLPIGYGEYSLWQAQQTQGRFERDCTFWREYLAGLEPYEVRQDFPFRPGTPSATGAVVRVPVLDLESFKAFERFALRQRASTFIALLAGFQVVLGSRTESEDRLSLTFFDQREHPATKGMVGYFLRPTPLRTRLAREVPLAKSLPAMTRSISEAYQRAYIPIHQIVDAYPQGAGSLLGQSAPWFFFFQYLPQAEPRVFHFGEARGRIIHSGANNRQEPGMGLRVRRGHDENLVLRIGYDPAQWREDTMRALADRYAKVVRAMLDDPSRTPGELLAAAGHW